MSQLHIVTGAFGYSGQYIAQRLLAAGHRVRTLTNSPDRGSPLHDKVEVAPLNFADPEALATNLRGAAAVYITYWVRFNHRLFSFKDAVRNTETLFAAAKAAGVGRVVYVSITNPDPACELEYFRGKGILERALTDSGLSYAILQPAVLFGMEDILVNNIAWLLRRVPVFAVFGDGQYKLQPIYVDDLAALAVEQGAARQNVTLNAIGPETFTYRGLVETIGRLIGNPRRILGVPPGLGYAVGKLAGWWLHDVVITRDEIRGLMENRLFVDTSPPALATTKLTVWVTANRDWLGTRYASELARRRNRKRAYVEAQ